MMSLISQICIFSILIVSVSPSSAQKHCFQEERSVTDLNVTEDPSGVSIDFRYNETIYENNNNEELISVPGCPKSVDGHPWIYRFLRISPSRLELRCHLAGTRGPCPSGKTLFVQSGTMYGVCGCECLLRKDSFEMKFSYTENKDDLQRYQVCYTSGIPQCQVFDKMDKTVCHHLGDEEPCGDGKVLAVAVANTWMDPSPLVCLPNCDISDEKWFIQQINGECTVVATEIAIAAGGSANLLVNDCPEDERYSGTLKKCVKRLVGQHLFLG